MHAFTSGDSFKTISSSFWWRDLLKVGISTPSQEDPFSSNCSFVVGNGFTTPFWEVVWLNNISLKDFFPDLFELSTLKKVSVAAMGGWREEEWVWGDLGITEEEVVQAGLVSELGVLRSLLENFGGLKGGRDSVSWSLESEKVFSVASCYNWYVSLRTPFGPSKRCEEALEIVWKLEVPYKIKVFAWRLFVNRLPTKDLLVYRGISFASSNSSLNCIFCNTHLEENDHTFFKCVVIKVVWREIGVWLDFPDRREEEGMSSFMEWFFIGWRKGIKDGKLGVFWLAVCWSIWLTRNGFCFRNDKWNINNIVWNIKFLVWRWASYGEIAYSNCNFYDFCKDPLSFMS
ncbi:uncharacterized protein LOC131605656 [Vicia villosa]|uniref:uncharacterized protein LOC131605656 n=1 Tax=Vicia villosa TaxID=3911 RepID=UPI00273A85D9|nr:uncharacterized protein LOC131605656 [Vicia villosa]